MAEELKKTGQLKVITIDDSFEDILKWDRAGESLRFATGLVFHELPRRELNRLNRENQIRYEVAHSEQTAVSDPDVDEEEEILQRIMTSASAGRAISRLRIDNERKGFTYSWLRPDMASDYIMPDKGWKPVVGGPERTMVNRTGKGPHIIQKAGQDELVLMARPLKIEAAERRAKKIKNKAYRDGVADAYADKISEAGGQPVGAGKQGAFSAIDDEE